MRRRPRSWAGVLAAVCMLATPAVAEVDLRGLCDRYTPLTLVGVDTAAGLALFAMPSRQEGIPGWIVELDLTVPAARLHPDWRKRRRFGGSIGPGPVLVLGRCGSDCLQLLGWRDGDWEEVGAPLAAASSATAYPSRELDGTPWLVLHRPTDDAGVILAEAWRLVDGGWEARGRLQVAGVGSPAVRPAPGGGVLTGSGWFRSTEAAGAWVSGLPGLPAQERGQLVPGGGREVAYLARGGRLYLSRDGGAAWEANPWWPWGAEIDPGAAKPRWSLDLPVVAPGSPLAVAWFDHRGPGPSQLALAERPAGGPWRVVARLPASEPLAGGEVGYGHLLRLEDGRWQLLAGCEVTPRGCGLRLRTVDAAGSTLVHSTRLRPAWLEER